MISLQNIEEAASLLKGITLKTPCIPSSFFSNKETKAFLKLENLQHTGSFKPRGAYIKLKSLNTPQRQKGILAMSAGNHAQGVAYHALHMGISATIVMPETTPPLKIERTKALGAKVILAGESLAEAEIYATPLAHEQGLTIIHPYDDWLIIQGQGTVGLEMLQEYPDLEVLVVPVGGGGLASGMAIAAKAINPKIKIYGVQSSFCPAMVRVLFPESPYLKTYEKEKSTLAEGIAVKATGHITRKILETHLDDLLVVSESDIQKTIIQALLNKKIVLEGAGAAGLAALNVYEELFAGKKVGVVLCGGNIDPKRLQALL